MAPSELILALGKVIIAAAWADGELSHEEINSLKDLLFRMPQMTAADWAKLEIYMETPVSEAERAHLVQALQDRLGRPADRELALATLEDLIQADGTVTDEERAVVAEIRDALQAVDLSILGRLSRVVRGPVQRRTDTVAEAPNREQHLEDFVKNKIFYNVRRRLAKTDHEIDLPETELRRLSLAGGLMARVAFVDRQVTDEEVAAMTEAIQRFWKIPAESAALVAEVAASAIAKNMDYYRLSRQFFETTSAAERRRFLDVLFQVASGDGQVSYHEMEEIRTIAKMLKLSHRQFIDAKLKVPRELR